MGGKAEDYFPIGETWKDVSLPAHESGQTKTGLMQDVTCPCPGCWYVPWFVLEDLPDHGLSSKATAGWRVELNYY